MLPICANLTPIRNQLNPTEANLGHLGTNLAPTWSYLGATWANLGQLGTNLGQLGANLLLTWAQLKPSRRRLGPPWHQLWLTWVQLRPTWDQDGIKMHHLGPNWATGDMKNRCFSFLLFCMFLTCRPSRNRGPIWGQLGPTWNQFRTILGPPSANLAST